MVSSRIAKGHTPKESWSRCEAPSMLYDTIRNPSARASVLKPVNKTTCVDTIESPQNQLKNQILDRFKSTGLQMPHESFVAVVQVGKYVFLAIMLPPYLLLYGIPRWFFVNVFSVALVQTGNLFLAMGKMISSRSAKVLDLMKGILDQLLGDALKLTKDKARTFLSLVQDLKIKFTDRLSKNIEQLKIWQDRLKVAVFNRISKRSHKIKNQIQNVVRPLQLLVIPLRKGIHLLTKLTKPLWSKGIVPIANGLYLNAIAAKKNAVQALKKVGNAFKPLNSKIVEIKETFVPALKNARKYLQRKLTTVLELSTSWMLEKLQPVKTFGLSISNAIAIPFISIGNKLIDKVSHSKAIGRFAVKALTPLAFVFKQSSQVFKSIFSYMIKGAKEELKRRYKNVILWKSSCKKLISKVFLEVKRSYGFFKWLGLLVKRVVVALCKVIFKSSKVILGYCLLLPKKISLIFQVLWKYLRKTFNKVANGLRLFLAVIWAVCYVGYYLLQEFNQSKKSA